MGRPVGGARPRLPVHLARPVGGPVGLPPRRGDVPGPDRGDRTHGRAVRGATPPVRGGAPVRRASGRAMACGRGEPDRARGGCALAGRTAVRVPLPSTVLAGDRPVRGGRPEARCGGTCRRVPLLAGSASGYESARLIAQLRWVPHSEQDPICRTVRSVSVRGRGGRPAPPRCRPDDGRPHCRSTRRPSRAGGRPAAPPANAGV